MVSSNWEFSVGDVLVRIGYWGKWVVSGTDSIDQYMLRFVLEHFDGLLDVPLFYDKDICERDYVKVGEYNV